MSYVCSSGLSLRSPLVAVVLLCGGDLECTRGERGSFRCAGRRADEYSGEHSRDGDSSSGLHVDRKSGVTGKSVSVRVDLGGRRLLKNKKRESSSIRTEKASNRRYQGS